MGNFNKIREIVTQLICIPFSKVFFYYFNNESGKLFLCQTMFINRY